jgi:catechol-2,3-dioxygenase
MTEQNKSTLRVQNLAGFGLEVPDLDVARRFYSSFGLTPVDADRALALSTGAQSAPEVLVLTGASKRLHHIAFGIHAADLVLFAEHLAAMGTPVTVPPFGQIRDGIWFRDPWGTWVNLTPLQDPPKAPEAPAAVAASGPRVDRHLWRELPRQTRPRRLGHMLIFTPDWERAQRFYSEALGLRVADRAAGKVAFMAAGTGVRDHHCFGLINSTHRGFQHASFQVEGIDQIAFGAMQMKREGYEGFGPGRHALASNLFYYVRDPWGSWLEYYADMDKISEAWEAKDWNDLPYIWPDWAPEFWGSEMNANLEPAA